MKCHNCGHAVVEGACVKCGSGAKPQVPTDTPESVYADLREVIPPERWAEWRADVARAVAEKRNPTPDPEQVETRETPPAHEPTKEGEQG